jgi:hypothetical protein
VNLGPVLGRLALLVLLAVLFTVCSLRDIAHSTPVRRMAR